MKVFFKISYISCFGIGKYIQLSKFLLFSFKRLLNTTLSLFFLIVNFLIIIFVNI